MGGATARPGLRGGQPCGRLVTRLAGAVALAVSLATPLAAQEAETRALQEGLAALGLYAGAVDGEVSAALDQAIAAYVRAAGFKSPPDRAFRNPGALARDVDLEARIRTGRVRVAERQTVPTRFGPLTVSTYRQEGGPPGFADGRRVQLGSARIDAGLASFAGCCDIRVVEVGAADIVVMQGAIDNPACPVTRVYVSLTDEAHVVTEAEDSCSAEPRIAVEAGELVVEAQARASLLDARWMMRPGEAMRFDRLIVPGDLATLAWWVGRQPTDKNERNFRFFHFAPLSDALAALLEPEALGWAFKMSMTSPVERAGQVLFVSGAYLSDESLVSVAVDLEERAVHACSFARGVARFSSTLTRGVYSDNAASCPADPDRAIGAWAAIGVMRGVRQRVFGFEGTFGDQAACRAGGDRVTRLTARMVQPAGEAPCAITEVGLADGDYVIGTVCRAFPVKRIGDDRIDLDGEVLNRCPD